jgi:hypothetical protein
MDFMTFEIAPDTEHSQIQNEGMRYEGLRFRAELPPFIESELLGDEWLQVNGLIRAELAETLFARLEAHLPPPAIGICTDSGTGTCPVPPAGFAANLFMNAVVFGLRS